MHTPDDVSPALRQGDPRLLLEPVAQQLLASAIPARMAYSARDGSPRLVPSWFHWTGEELVMVTYLAGPGFVHAARRLTALRADPRVAVSIDSEGFPPQALSLRGEVMIDEVEEIAPEYAEAARRYLGRETAEQMLSDIDHPSLRQARISLNPRWVGLLDFDSRFPSAQGAVEPDGQLAEGAP